MICLMSAPATTKAVPYVGWEHRTDAANAYDPRSWGSNRSRLWQNASEREWFWRGRRCALAAAFADRFKRWSVRPPLSSPEPSPAAAMLWTVSRVSELALLHIWRCRPLDRTTTPLMPTHPHTPHPPITTHTVTYTTILNHTNPLWPISPNNTPYYTIRPKPNPTQPYYPTPTHTYTYQLILTHTNPS